MDLAARAIRSKQRNVLGGQLTGCSHAPAAGFYRTGCCETSSMDIGSHTVCAVMTADFLAFTRACGNDLSRPAPGFDGLQPGDRWCLCAARWKEALEAGLAPPIVLAATNQRSLELVDLDDLRRHAIDTD